MMLPQRMILHLLLILFVYISVISSRIDSNNIFSNKVHGEDHFKNTSEYQYLGNGKEHPISYHEPKTNIGNLK